MQSLTENSVKVSERRFDDLIFKFLKNVLLVLSETITRVHRFKPVLCESSRVSLQLYFTLFKLHVI